MSAETAEIHPEPEPAERARALFDAGIASVRSGDFEAALQAFERSLSLLPSAPAALNRALCLRNLEQWVEAITALENYVHEYGSELDEEQRAGVRAELDELERHVVQVTIVVLGPDEAEVRIDGEPIGRSPFDRPFRLELGDHEVRVTADGYQPFQRSVVVENGNAQELRLELERTPEPGALRVAVTVPGTTFWLDGRELGPTPSSDETIEVAAGDHVLELRREGYETAQASGRVEPGETVAVELELSPLAELPEALSAELAVQASEPASVVLVDSRPFADGVVPIGPHDVIVHREGFQPWVEQVVLEAGQRLIIDATLEPTEPFVYQYRSRARSIRAASYALLGLGAAGILTTFALYLWNDDRYEGWDSDLTAIESELADGPPYRDGLWQDIDGTNQLSQSLHDIEVASWIVVGVSSALAVVGLLLRVFGPNPIRYRSETSTDDETLTEALVHRLARIDEAAR